MHLMAATPPDLGVLSSAQLNTRVQRKMLREAEERRGVGDAKNKKEREREGRAKDREGKKRRRRIEGWGEAKGK